MSCTYYDNQSMIYQFLTFHLVLMKPFLDHLNCKRKKHSNDTDCLFISSCLTDILRGFILNRQVTESIPPTLPTLCYSNEYCLWMSLCRTICPLLNYFIACIFLICNYKRYIKH